MDTKGKYVRHCNLFIAFSTDYQHRELAMRIFGRDKLFHGAGFINTKQVDNKIVINCYGKSESLKKAVRRDDNVLILKAMGTDNKHNGIVKAKYMSNGYKGIVCSEEMEFPQITFGNDSVNAGYVRLIPQENGTIKIHCFDGEEKISAGVGPDDHKFIADALGITEKYEFSY
jgi:hypothetical protein